MSLGLKFSQISDISLKINVLFIAIFIVISNTESGPQLGSHSLRLLSNISANDGPILRHRRSIYRGQNVHYQKSYDLNRLRYELENSLRAPRHKPYFHRVNEVYSYYLPPKFTKINSNVENFSDNLREDGMQRSYGTKTRSMTRARGQERVSFARRVLPTHKYYPDGDLGHTGFVDADPVPPPITPYQGSRPDFRPPYARVSPDSVRRGLPPILPKIDSNDPNDRGVSYSRTSSRSSQSYSADTTGLIPEPQSLIRNSSFPGIPGWQRIDFPGYATVPATGFRCASQAYYGYYADVNAGCQVFHVCQPDGREYSFLCPNSTLFHQKVQTCDWWWHVDCPSSPRYYYLNARIGVLPPVDATLYRFPKS